MAIRGATIRDVAHRAGVSVGTASKAFNNKGKLAAETRRRVLEAAAELNFAPNALIRSLQRGRTYTIGVLTWDVRTDPSRDITMHLLKGMTEGIADAHCDTLLYSLLEDRPAERMAATLLDGRADGIIVAPGLLPQAGWNGLATSGIPMVAVYRRDVSETIGYVGVDNQTGILAAVDHLRGLGHRRIAFYASYPTFDFVERGEAYRLGLERNGLPFDPAIFTLDPATTPTAFCNTLLSLSERPTAVIAGDDADTINLMEVLRARGLRVPEDISLIGFDDAAAAVVPPGLTTIRQPAREVGRTAARFVNALIQGASAAECRTVLPVEFIVRGTTCPPSRRS